MENILPIVILIVWLVFSLYNKEQKRKKKASYSGSKKDAEPDRPSLLEQLLSGNLNLQSQPFVKEVEPDEPESWLPEEREPLTESKINIPKPFLTEELDSIQEEGQRSTSIKKTEDPEDVEINTDGELSLSGINFRKAVIYSEILNAPYINY